jgi:bifunctional non-homologous end joining protein LigD
VAGTPVSMPLTWEELEHAHPMDFRMSNVIERLRRNGDRWQGALSLKQDLTRSLATQQSGDAAPRSQRARPVRKH